MHYSIPLQLHYLRSTLEFLEAVPPEDLTEDNAAAIDRVVSDLRHHFNEGGRERVAEDLSSDTEVLANWLEQLDNTYLPGEFLLGVVSCLNGEDLLLTAEGPNNRISPHRAVIEFGQPPGFTHVGSLSSSHFQRGDVDIVIVAVDTTVADPSVLLAPPPESLRKLFPQMPAWEYSTVEFGSVSGNKRQDSKGVDYVLKVPGGWVSVQIHSKGAPVSVEDIEPYLGTLRFR